MIDPSDRANSTKAIYRLYTETYYIPRLGSHPLRDLNPDHVQRFIKTLLTTPGRRGKPLSVQYVCHLRSVLIIALNHAVSTRKVMFNAAALTKVNRKIKAPETSYVAPDDLQAFKSGIKGSRHAVLYETLLTVGLRIGEALGLRWSDLDFVKGEIAITRQLLRDKVTRAFIFRDLKTEGSVRTLPLPAVLVRSLKAHKSVQNEDRLRLGTDWHDDNLVFCTVRGTPLHRESVRQCLNCSVSRAGLAHLRIHDLRHTYATLTLDSGVDAMIVRDALGHTKLATTVDRYAKVLPSKMRSAADAMDRLYGTGD